MHSISSISEFLLEARTEYRIFDMGRSIRHIDAQLFLDIENGTTPAPYPRQQMCWLGILFWNRSLSQQQYIWFLKLPLDENGCVVSAHRDQFLHIILDALGKEFIEEHQDAKLPDNPYQFAPPQQQMADFNAAAKQLLSLPLSQEAQQAKAYLAAPADHDWQTISVQGLSDAITQSDSHTCNGFIQHWADYPVDVLRPLSAALENVLLEDAVRASLTARIYSMPAESEQTLLLMRAVSRDNQDKQLRTHIIRLLQQDKPVHQDLLVILAGRYWHWCEHQAFLMAFLEACVKAGCFGAIYPDLVQIPSVRHHLLSVLRSPERSDALSKAIGELFRG